MSGKEIIENAKIEKGSRERERTAHAADNAVCYRVHTARSETLEDGHEKSAPAAAYVVEQQQVEMLGMIVTAHEGESSH